MLIAVVNESTVVNAADAQVMVAACAHQLRYHAGPVLGKHYWPVILYPDLASIPAGAAVMAILDNADQAGALGYHDETPDGRPYGKVFAKTVTDNGGTSLHGSFSVSVTLSHEVLEMFMDPNINLWADDGGIHEIAVEACDPVEGDSYTVSLTLVPGGVSVSNFVVNAYFDKQNLTGPWDYMRKLAGPWTMTKGGYLLIRSAGQINQKFGDEYPEWKKAGKAFPAARTAKRIR